MFLYAVSKYVFYLFVCVHERESVGSWFFSRFGCGWVFKKVMFCFMLCPVSTYHQFCSWLRRVDLQLVKVALLHSGRFKHIDKMDKHRYWWHYSAREGCLRKRYHLSRRHCCTSLILTHPEDNRVWMTNEEKKSLQILRTINQSCNK